MTHGLVTEHGRFILAVNPRSDSWALTATPSPENPEPAILSGTLAELVSLSTALAATVHA